MHVRMFFSKKNPWQGSTLTKVKNRNCLIALFDSSNEASWCTDYNAKNQISSQLAFFEKEKIMTSKKVQKIGLILLLFQISSIKIHQILSVSFTLNSVDQYTSFKPFTTLWT